MADLAAEPVVVMVKRYKCPFCPRGHSTRKRAIAHIARCWLNPAVRGCKTCAHYSYYRGGEPCFPGRYCDCNESIEECERGCSLASGLRTNCPLWALRKDPNADT